MAWHARRREKAPRKTGACLISPLPSSASMPPRKTGPLGGRLVAALESYGTWLTIADLLLRCPFWLPSRQRAVERCHRALRRLCAAGLVRSWTWRPDGARPVSFWASGEDRPMNLEDAQELILRGVSFGDVYPQVREEDRAGLREWYVRDSRVPTAESVQSRTGKHPATRVLLGSGNVCPKCGAPLVRDGKCELCVSCGETVGSCS